MTEWDKLYFAEQIGDIMDTLESAENTGGQGRGVSIHVNSPNNRITGGDYFEINIHLKDGSEHDSEARETDEADTHGAVEIQKIVTNVIESLFPNGVGVGR